MFRTAYLVTIALSFLAQAAWSEAVTFQYRTKAQDAHQPYLLSASICPPACGSEAHQPKALSNTDGVINFFSEMQPAGEEAGPMAGVHGPCIGVTRVAKGKRHGSGYCVMSDVDDSTVVIRWWGNAGYEATATWAYSGGTGKWANATGGGYLYNVGGAPGVTDYLVYGSVEFE